MEPSEGPGVGIGDGIETGAGLNEGPWVGTDDGPILAEGLADEPDKGSADGAGLDEVLADGELRHAPRSYTACQRSHRKYVPHLSGSCTQCFQSASVVYGCIHARSWREVSG